MSKGKEVRPSNEYWLKMRINPKKVLDNYTSEKGKEAISRFGSEALKEFYNNQTGRDAGSLSKDDLISLIQRRHSDLEKTLFLIHQYSLYTAKRVLRQFCKQSEYEVKRETKLQLGLILFNRAPEKLLRARIVSIGHRIQKNYPFTVNPKKLRKEISESDVIEHISKEIEKKLSTLEKRAELQEHLETNDGQYKLFIKYERGKKRIEEWDSEYWIRPIDWVVANYDSEEYFLNIRCKDEERALGVASIISNELTGSKDSFKQVNLEQWLKPVSEEVVLKEFEREKFQIVDINIKYLKLENIRIKNSPTITIRGERVNESISDLDAKYGFDIIAGAEIAAYKIRIVYEYEGITDEPIVSYSKRKPGLNYSKTIPERAQKYLIEFLNDLWK